jgi:putative Mg2+ transporter-C (MgtC) family protein
LQELLKEFSILSPIMALARISFATLTGFFIGLDRERHSQPAGLRTHMVICLGACIMMMLSIYIPSEFIQRGFSSDPGRLAAQVISGIGFLGAGAIFRFGFSVKGLTTAASIWTTSGIGLCFGAGYFYLGIISTLFLIIVLYVFDKIEDHIIERRNWRIITVGFDSDQILSSAIVETIKTFATSIKQTSVLEKVDQKITEVVINCKIDEDLDIKVIFDSIKALGHIRNLRID